MKKFILMLSCILLFEFFIYPPNLVLAEEGRLDSSGNIIGEWFQSGNNFYKTILNASCSSVNTGTCNQGQKGDCLEGCASSSSTYCCNLNLNTIAWNKYDVTCSTTIVSVSDFTYNGIKISMVYNNDQVCSIGDKCFSGDIGLRTNSPYTDQCSCDSIKPENNYYKYCCTPDGYPQNCYGSDINGDGLDEGGCLGGYMDGMSNSSGYVSSYPCVPKNTCTGECISGITTCSDNNNSDYTYANATGNCFPNTDLCCTKSPVITPTPVCTTDNATVKCNDNTNCTTDTCLNPGTDNASCSNVLNGFCPPTGPLYYCDTTSYSCTTTSASYSLNADGISSCESNLSSFMSDTTTGSCYTSFSSCSSSCNPPIPDTPTGTASCTPWSCPAINGVCSTSAGSCISGTSSGTFDTSDPHTIGWTCYGSE